MEDRGAFRLCRSQSLWMGVSAVALSALLFAPSQAHAAVTDPDPDPETVTYSQDIAPILNESCVTCHSPNGMAPMSLMNYDEVRPWARIIKTRTENRVMPPWHLDPTVGIQKFKNDASLSQDEIETIARWVDSGAPEGDPADLPPAVELPEPGAWQLAEKYGRPPDLVIKSEPYTVSANSQDQWWSPVIEFTELDKPRWAMASEFHPAFPDGIKVVHHGHAHLEQPGRDGEMTVKAMGRYGIGKPGDVYPDDTGILINPGGKISWNLHYFPIDRVVKDDVVEVGLWFYPEGEEPRWETKGEERYTAGLPEDDMPWAGDIVIPPHSVRTQQGVHVLDEPAILHSYRPHMHMRGKEQSLEVIYPDGRKELISRVDNYDHFWQIQYQYADDVKPLLPAGSVLLITTTWDNTERNRVNPDPDQWVVFGQRGVDEMSHAWLGITHLDDASFAELKAEREALPRVLGEGGN